MAVVLFTRVPELTPERYDRLMLELRLDGNPPAGLLLHITSESAGSVNVCEVWQTEQAAESFVERRLREALRQQGVRETLSYRLEPLRNLFAPDVDMIGRIGSTSLPGSVARSSFAS